MKRDPMIWLLNAPKMVRQGIALGVFLLCTGLAIGGAWLAVSKIRDTQSAVLERREMLGRLQAIAALKPALLQDGGLAGVESSADFLEGQSEAIVRGNLQAKLNAISSAQTATLLSVGNVPDLEIDGTRYIGVRADLSGSVDTIYNTVLAIEMASALSIREASIWRSGSDDGARAPEISAQLHIYGALNPALQIPVPGATQ